MSRAERQDRHQDRRGRHDEAVFDPIWARRARAGRRAPRSRDDIAQAAIAVADAEGIDAVSMRRVAAELGLGTMSLYHYVGGKDELLDLMSDAILGLQIVDDAELQKGWRPALRAIASAMRPRPRAIPGPNSLRHFDQSVAALADTDLEVQTKMEIIALVDDYVFGFSLRAFIAVLETREEQAEPGWMQAVFDYMAAQLETGAYPNIARIAEANRAAGGRDEDLAEMALDQDRFERGLDRLLDGVEVELKRRRGR
jgi:AcrR family transcriptional regulator